MQIAQLDQLDPDYRHVYVSPHLDDVALSAGGAVLLHRAAGEQVLVVALCTAAPAPEDALSDLAHEFHRSWGLSPAEAMATRLREEQQAMALLDIDYYWAGLLDAIYRFPQAYSSRDTLFGTPAPGDPLGASLRPLLAALRDQLPQATFYAPLGIGEHVDHQIALAACQAAGIAPLCYEDFPYVVQPGAGERRRAALAVPLYPRSIAIDATLEAKIAAISCYASQLGELFGGPEAMAAKVTRYARTVAPPDAAYGERLWAYDTTTGQGDAARG
jgi:LmbE family N-acetylglucosaminyl deacetylase